jgi:UDP-2-acetamido-2,6-beta-L-arabino-hexul-4-ose reductase
MMLKLKVGITGQSGFIGQLLFNFLRFKENISLVPFYDEYFNDDKKLDEFVKDCDIIFHLAALNRHNSEDVIYETNLLLVNKLINACKRMGARPHIVFSSSIQEGKDNAYGKSKKEGRLLFEKWANENNAKFTGLIIPNVFGPFGRPFHNSVISTFSYQLINNLEPKIEVDNKLNLIYINDLLDQFWEIISSNSFEIVSKIYIKHTVEKKVSEILSLLIDFKESYINRSIIPRLNDKFDIDLFNTFRSYIQEEKLINYLDKKTDHRGTFVEVLKTQTQGQFSYSTTLPGVTRGNHFHLRKIERFIVIKGKAEICIRRIGTNKVIKFNLDEENPAYIDIPIWYTHNIKNIGDTELITLFWTNEFFKQEDPDTFYEAVENE